MSTPAIIGIVLGALVGCALLLSLLSGLVLFFALFSRKLPMDFTKSKRAKLMGNMDAYLAHVHTWSALLKQRPYEPVQIMSAHGNMLTGYFFAADVPSRHTVLCLHGYRSGAFADFASIAPAYLQHGYNVLLANQEGHGDSQGNWIGFGVLDRDNTPLWCRAIQERVPGGDIVLHGVSMGGSTCLASCTQPLPGVVAVVSDCAFTSPRAIIRAVRTRTLPFLPAFPLIPMAELWTRLILKYDFHSVTALGCVPKSRYPLLFLHGDGDKFVPPEMAAELYEAAAQPKRLHLIAGAGHAASHMKNPDEYEGVLFAFLQEYVPAEAQPAAAADGAEEKEHGISV